MASFAVSVGVTVEEMAKAMGAELPEPEAKPEPKPKAKAEPKAKPEN